MSKRDVKGILQSASLSRRLRNFLGNARPGEELHSGLKLSPAQGEGGPVRGVAWPWMSFNSPAHIRGGEASCQLLKHFVVEALLSMHSGVFPSIYIKHFFITL